MTPEVQLIAVNMPDGTTPVLHFVTKGMLGPSEIFEREATDEAINAELEKSGLGTNLGWRRIALAEYKSLRETRKSDPNASAGGGAADASA
jgi:hypothetical protein